MIDLNNEEEQKERKHGPVPAGSRVLVRMEIQKPMYPAPFDPMIARTKAGIFCLYCKFTVIAGQYESVYWYEYITLPQTAQQAQMNDNQRLSARIGGSMIRAIIEANRHINPKSKEAAAVKARQISAWQELDGMAFPARLILDKRPYTTQDGREFWNNRISTVVPITSKEYAALMNGGEFINENGEVRGKSDNSKAGNASQSEGEAFWENPPAYATDDVPF